MDEKTITEAFERVLKYHGYGFQYGVLKEAQRLNQEGKSSWVPWVPEFPVEIQGSDTRIDILLYNPQRRIYMVCECKRANPASSNWCFARARRPAESGYASTGFIESLRNDGKEVSFEIQSFGHSEEIFQIGLEVKTGQMGDASGTTKSEIEAAVSQVCRGLNGLMQFFGGDRAQKVLNVGEVVGFIPVVITTAKIFATEAEIVSKDVSAGDVKPLRPPLRSYDWIWYDYPQSRGLKHNLPDQQRTSDLREIYYREYVRRIGIVNASGISSFLGMSIWG